MSGLNISFREPGIKTSINSKVRQFMDCRPISNPWRNTRSQTLLALIALWVTLAYLAGHHDSAGSNWFPSCPLSMVAGIPCPFCGLTTGSSWMVRGDVVQAFQSNILAPMLGIGLLVATIYILGCRMGRGVALDLELGPTQRQALWWAAGFLVLLSWVFNIYRIIPA